MIANPYEIMKSIFLGLRCLWSEDFNYHEIDAHVSLFGQLLECDFKQEYYFVTVHMNDDHLVLIFHWLVEH